MKKIVFLMMVVGLVGIFNSAYGQTYVDLGLSSGTKWSNTNVKVFHKFKDAQDLFGSKMPSKAQWEELRIECKWTWVKGKNPGYRVTGPNGNSIFLPAAGYRDCNGDVKEVSTTGCYWSRTEYKHYTLFHDYEGEYILHFDSSSVKVVWEDYCGCFSVRFVKD